MSKTIDSFITEPKRQIPVTYSVDVVVAGGGVAGLTCAISAARCGANVLLVERNGFLGGTATAGMMPVFFGPYRYSHGLAKEFFDALISRGTAAAAESMLTFLPEDFKELALEMVSQSRVHLLLNSWICDAICEAREVRGIIIENKSGRQAILGKVIVDATGDADVAFRSGAACQRGRESDNLMRPITLLFMLGNIDFLALKKFINSNPSQFSTQRDRCILDLDKSIIRVFGFFDLVRQSVEKEELDPFIHYVRLEGGSVKAGTVIINAVRVYGVDGTKAEDLVRAEIEGRRQVRQLTSFLKKHVPGFERVELICTGSALGVRETRRVIGKYIFTEEDVARHTKFPDVVATNYQYGIPGAPMHEPTGNEGGAGDSRERGDILESLWKYNIPYRCFLPKEMKRLLCAGRCLSVSHTGDRWVRAMPDCMITGQVAGIAAAMSAKENIDPENLNISLLQSELKRNGIRIEDGLHPI